MYVYIVLAFMIAFPAASVIAEILLGHQGGLSVALAGKWFVFWTVGVRLFVAGLRQIIQPRFTAETILGIKGEESWLVVRELGFANCAIGSIGIGSLFSPGWVLPAALAGSLFYGLAGINHLYHKARNSLQNVALISDLFAAMALLIVIVCRAG
jgi:uncharacterized protein DUF6790